MGSEGQSSSVPVAWPCGLAHPILFFSEHHLHPEHFADNPLPFLPQTQWKVNWMFYAFAISKKWKERRFQPYFNNKYINFYLLTDTCTNFLKCSLCFFFDLSGFVGLMMKAYFKCKKISSLCLNSTITDRVMSPSWKRAGQTFKVTRVYYKSGSNNFNYFTLQKISKLP